MSRLAASQRARSPHAALVAAAIALAGLTSCGDSAPGPALTAVAGSPSAAPLPHGLNAVTDWATIVAGAVHSAAEPRTPGDSIVLHALVHLAVYDAVVAIRGGYEPFVAAAPVAPGANVEAAVAAAAHRAARARVNATQQPALDRAYAEYLTRLPAGAGRDAGIAVGERAADSVLAARADDRFGAPASYDCSATPVPAGEFEPNGGCGAQPMNVATGRVHPFTFDDPAKFRPAPPPPMTSAAYAKEFNEVRRLGGLASAERTAQQTQTAYFWSEHAYAHWNRNLLRLAAAEQLDILDTARLFAMTQTAAADAVIAGAAAKYHYRWWRPRTAIVRAAEDGNDGTSADPAWKPLLSVDHPEYPAGHAFVSTAIADAIGAFFSTGRVALTMVTSRQAVPMLTREERTYADLSALLAEVSDARIFSGLHYRSSMRAGERLGHAVARHVLAGHFRAQPGGRAPA